MDYATQADLIERFGEQELIQLTDESGRGIIDEDKVARALADAAGEIDAHIESRLQLPLDTVPRALTRIACDITRYYLYDDAVPEQIAKRYDDAIRFLRAVARGDMQIGAASESPSTDKTVDFSAGGNVWDRSDDGFI